MKRTPRTKTRPDPIETAIEDALRPGDFIPERPTWSFVSELEAVEKRVEALVTTDPARAVALFDTFLAGAYAKAEELDDSGGNFGMFVDGLYVGWIRARQAVPTDPAETARLLADRMDHDDYGFTFKIERDAVPAFDKQGLAAFRREAEGRFEGKAVSAAGAQDRRLRNPEFARRVWGDVLRAVYAQMRDVQSYLALCEKTETTPEDCVALARIQLAKKKPAEALAWVQRGTEIAKTHRQGSGASYELGKLRRELLVKLGKGNAAIDDAWREFAEFPSAMGYETLMKLVPKAKHKTWHTKAMDAAEGGELGYFIELCLATKETERLVHRLAAATPAALEGLSHYRTEPAAKHLARSHPGLAGKLYRALAMRILNAKKSRYYDAALRNFEDAKRCFEKANDPAAWAAIVAEVRREHSRKSIMADFERIVAGQGSRTEPSFLERAKTKWKAGSGG
jgi:hypothetical protein